MKGMIHSFKPILIYRNILLVLLLIGASAYGQGSSIVGRAFDEVGKKFGPVRVVVYDQDKKKVYEEKTAGSGKFKIKDIPDGKYTLNLYGEGGRGVTENITVNGANLLDLKPGLSPNPDQVQLSIKATSNGALINWKTVPDAKEFIIYRDNEEIATVSETSYLDPVKSGKTFAYNVVALKNDASKGVRSITEYGKTSISFPTNIEGSVKKNVTTLTWDPVETATAYKIYRDDKEINKTADNSFSDFNLKYETEFSYQIVALDQHSEEGEKSSNVFITTHPEIEKPKSLKAESGANQVTLNWKTAENSVTYYVYQNGTLVDSTTSLTIDIITEAGTENCFSVAGG